LKEVIYVEHIDCCLLLSDLRRSIEFYFVSSALRQPTVSPGWSSRIMLEGDIDKALILAMTANQAMPED